MHRSFIDDNGNPFDDGDDDDLGRDDYFDPVKAVVAGVSREEEDEQMYPLPGGRRGQGDFSPPKYFINAAELSEEEFQQHQQQQNENQNSSQIPVLVKVGGESNNKLTSESGGGKKSSIIPRPRSRVPVSKSYPDIVQTTLNNDFKGFDERKPNSTGAAGVMASQDNNDVDVVADSLENLSVQPEVKVKKEMEAEEEEKVPIPPGGGGQALGGGIMASSAFMTESQMGGILGEKPPEAWVIDLNSLSLQSTDVLESQTRDRSESMSNSLVFFVNVGDDEGISGSVTSRMSGSGQEKKIFNMFVDIKEGDGNNATLKQHHQGQHRSQIPKKNSTGQGGIVNKAVFNVMETSTSSSASGKSTSAAGRKFPSPIFNHKTARQLARAEWEKEKEKLFFDSLDPQVISMQIAAQEAAALGDSTISNRSSLHVANVLDSSFSSSIISSMETQGEEVEICSGGACFKLQLDLTRMFQEGINTDVIISVNGKWIRAHKCILASRSQYFAAILSGHWVEKAGNTINLDGFSYSTVQFALYHIYSGTNEIPDTIDLLELATLTDLLGLEGLRENISQTFRVKFCHNFHRPCTGCITGVLECFPIAATYGMDDLHRKMIKWICKHFVRIWPTKGFASLGEDLKDKCLKYSVNHLSVDNILDHTLGCDQLTTTMPSLRWTETIFNLVNQLGDECVQFLGEHLSDVLQSEKFLQFGKGQAWNISRIEDTFLESMTLLRPDMACRTHTALERLIDLGTETIDDVEWSTSFVDFLKSLRSEVEKFLFANASKAVLSKGWEELGAGFRKKICASSFVGYDKFGNKVVKNSAVTGGQGTGTGQGKRSSGNSSSSKGGARDRPTSSATKVASVRPMRHRGREEEQEREVERAEVEPEVKKPVPTPRTVRTLSSLGRSESSSEASQRSSGVNAPTRAGTANTRASAPAAEKAFISSRRTSTSSPTTSRTPNRVLTPGASNKTLSTFPVAPERAVTPTGSKKIMSAMARNHALARQATKPPPSPPKKTFVTNSAKAAAVSKPILNRARTSSGMTPPPTTQHQQQAQQVVTSNNTTATNQRAISKPETGRLTTTTTFSARNSFSGVERPKTTPSGRGRTAATGNTRAIAEPISRRTAPQVTPSSRGISQTTNKRPVSSSTTSRGGGRVATTGRSTTSSASGPRSMPNQTVQDFRTFSESFQPDSLISSGGGGGMSRSTIVDTEGGDEGGKKTRTLAEIGRSSTFSKDEPTILGKMEGFGGCGQQDESGGDDGDYQYEDDYEEDEDY